MIGNDPMELLRKTVELVEKELGSELDELKVERAVIGLFFIGIKLSNGEGGLCFTPLKDLPSAVCCPSSAEAMPNSGRLTQRPVRQYLADLFGKSILKKALGTAVLNALSELILKRRAGDYKIVPGDAFKLVPLPKPGQKVAVVGALVPMLRVLLRDKADFTVLELDKATLKGEELRHYRPAEDAPQVLPHADIDVITGVTILNNTLPGLLECAKPGAFIMIAGPTASMLPDAFFEAGVTAMGGLRVTDPDALLTVLAEGGSGYHIFEKSVQRYVVFNPKARPDL